MTQSDQLSFRQMCAQFNVTPRTLRYYEYIELLSPQRDGRNRRYGPRDVARMTLIMRGKRFGFSLEEIRRWLELYDAQGTAAQLRAFLDLADRQIAVLTAAQAERARSIAELRALREQTAALLARGATEPPTAEPPTGKPAWPERHGKAD